MINPKIHIPPPGCKPQFANSVISIWPTLFKCNDETIQDNVFQNRTYLPIEVTTFMAQTELANYIKNMMDAGIEVISYVQNDPKAPDSIYPDWFTVQRGPSIPDGVLTLFPMRYPSRRKERDEKIINELKKTCKYFIDLTYLEASDQFIEGKGSVIYDHRNNKLYCCISPRATIAAVEAYVTELNKISLKPWKAVVFTGVDQNGQPIYHTDCMLQILDKHVLLCVKSLDRATDQGTIDRSQRERVISELTDPKSAHPYQVVDISYEEVNHMCCNIFNVINKKNENVLLMSKQASENYTPDHLMLLKTNYEIVVSDVTTIEKLGGGSTRCLLAELL